MSDASWLTRHAHRRVSIIDCTMAFSWIIAVASFSVLYGSLAGLAVHCTGIIALVSDPHDSPSPSYYE